MSRLVTVSRRLVKGEPINVRVQNEDGEVGASAALEDFLAALADAISPAFVFTKAQLRTKLTAAADAALAEMKSHTKHVV